VRANQPRSPQDRRLVGLDGLRGLAALFVVLHHCYLFAFDTYPVNSGPLWAAWMFYGHFAVAIFIVLSGFSLSVAPARAGWQLGGVSRFAQRRAWRILPPYWAALVFSLLIAWFVIPAPGEAAPTLKSVFVDGALLQDVIGAPTPNGAFWSIAIEAQLYFVFPLLIWLVYRYGGIVMLSLVTAVVVAVGALAPHVFLVHQLLRFTPQFAALFALGVMAAGIVRVSRYRTWPWHWLALATAIPAFGLIAYEGSVWTVDHFLWVDLALGPTIGCLLAAISTDRPQWMVKVLDTKPLRSLGSFSYSLYLTHAPIVAIITGEIVRGRVPSGVPALLVTLAIALPVTLIFARLFAGVFELPFQRHRSWSALREAFPLLAWRRRTVARHRLDQVAGRGYTAAQLIGRAPAPEATAGPELVAEGDPA
jgi:peptidoglycan/LPS O-acetylase OafA/YrhL